MKIFYTDTETTGFQPGQIAQLTYFVAEGRKVKKAVNHFMTVESMPMQATAVHGLTVESLSELSQGKTFRHIRDELQEDLDGALFVAFSAKFDARFIHKEFLRVGTVWQPDGIFCPMEYLRTKMPIVGNKNPKLSEALNMLKIDKNFISEQTGRIFKSNDNRAHDARYDTVALVYLCHAIEDKFGVSINDLKSEYIVGDYKGGKL